MRAGGLGDRAGQERLSARAGHPPLPRAPRGPARRAQQEIQHRHAWIAGAHFKRITPSLNLQQKFASIDRLWPAVSLKQPND